MFSSTRLSITCCLMAALSVIVTSVYAHNVVSGAYAEGMMIEGEIGYSNGDMAEAGSPVQVLNASGDILAEISLKDGGVFSYKAAIAAKHIFKANLSAGHVAEMTIEADELAAPSATPLETLATVSPMQEMPSAEKPNASESKEEASALASDLTVDQLQSIIRSAVAQQVKPLQKELRAYKEKVMFRDIAGGLGFIFGLFGVAAWMASRREKGEKDATVS